MPQKTLIITVATFVVLGIGILAGTFFFLQTGPAEETITQPTPSPFGEGGELVSRGGELSFPQENVQQETPLPVRETPRSAVRQLTKTAIAGKTFVARDNKTFVRYMERATGHIYEIGDTENTARISNRTLPGIYEALWGKNGDISVVRYLNPNGAIKSVREVVSVGTNAGSATLQGTALPDNVQHAAVAGDGRIFYLGGVGGAAVGTVVSVDGKSKKQIFNSPVAEWEARWADATLIAVATKPSYASEGFIHLLNSKDGSLQKILGNIRGLTALLSPDKKNVLFSRSTETDFKTYLYDIKNKTAFFFPVVTLPEKCAWKERTVYCGAPREIPEALYPDDWYQGVVSFSDDIWKIDADTGAVDIVVNGESSQDGGFDATGLMIQSDGTSLLFTNKNDSTLWSVELKK